jgi:hypothetical protein
MTLPKLCVIEFQGDPAPSFPEEPEPRCYLLVQFLFDMYYDAAIRSYQSKLARAEAGENDITLLGTVCAYLSRDIVVIEAVLSQNEENQGLVPDHTKITMEEAKQLTEEWRIKKRQFRDSHPE